MEAVSTRSAVTDPISAVQSGDARRYERLTQLHSAQSVSTGITIVTAEGDRVTLNSSASRTLDALTYSRHVASGETREATQVEGYQLLESAELSIEVQGELSKAELRDVHKAIRSAREMLEDLREGDMEGALKEASRFGSLTTLNTLEAHTEYVSEIAASDFEYVGSDGGYQLPASVVGLEPGIDSRPASTGSGSDFVARDEELARSILENLRDFKHHRLLRNEDRLLKHASGFLRELAKYHGSGDPLAVPVGLVAA